GRIPTKIELTLEQSQQGVSNDVLLSIEGVEELKRNVWIKGENKPVLPTLKVETESIHMLSVFTKVNSVKMEILLELALNKLLVDDLPVVELNQPDVGPVIPEPVLVDEDEDPEEEEFEEEEEP
nr:hypothetical protein [Tanacetum cinerariifolium]